MDLSDWLDGGRARRLVGRGPARQACLVAIDAFVAGARGEDPEAMAPPLRGFATEGAALRARALGRVLVVPGERETFAAIGRGFYAGLARLPVADDPWEADGHGFHDALLAWNRTVKRRAPPPGVTGFDRGVGRALWYVHAGEARAIERSLAWLGASRADGLWCGVGVASAYTGGAAEQVEALGLVGGAAFRRGRALGNGA